MDYALKLAPKDTYTTAAWKNEDQRRDEEIERRNREGMDI